MCSGFLSFPTSFSIPPSPMLRSSLPFAPFILFSSPPTCCHQQGACLGAERDASSQRGWPGCLQTWADLTEFWSHLLRPGTAASHCLGAGSPGTQLHAGVVPGSCPSVLDPGWSSSSCSAALPTAAAPCRELGSAEAAWPPGICGAIRAPRRWKLLLAMAMRGCCTSALQCQESCGQPWIR